MKMAKKMWSRFAPTPSGYLHLGNVFNLLAVDRWRTESGGSLLLRIDDADRGRYRREYAEDIFRMIDWMGISFDAGPSTVAELETEWSQEHRFNLYQEALDRLARASRVFACTCSRTEIAATSDDGGGYPGTCRELQRPLHAPDTAWRLFHDGEPLQRDPVVRLKDGNPSYHVASVLDDVQFGITHVIRGMDLRETSVTQAVIANALGLDAFADIHFTHHALLPASDGTKRSKSAGHRGVSMLMDPSMTPARIRDDFEAWWETALNV